MPHVALAAIFGLAVGSFINVCIYRIPREQSVVWPASRCPNCQHPIRFYDNIPIVSYLLLGGSCRHCGAPISARYPLVEATTAAMFSAYAAKFGMSAALAVNLLLGSLILILVFVDYDFHLLPDVLTFPGIALGVATSPWQSLEYAVSWFQRWLSQSGLEHSVALALANSLAGVLLGAGPLWLVGWIFFKWTGREGLGFGDVKLMAMVGAFLGWALVLVVLVWGSLLGSLVGVFFVLFRGKGRDYHYPFGTFPGVAALLAVLWGPGFIGWYAGFF